MKRGFIYQIWIWCSEGASVNPPFYYTVMRIGFVQQDKSMGYYGFVPTHPHKIANLTKGKNCMMDHDVMQLCSQFWQIAIFLRHRIVSRLQFQHRSIFATIILHPLQSRIQGIPGADSQMCELSWLSTLTMWTLLAVHNDHCSKKNGFPHLCEFTIGYVYVICHPDCGSLMGNDVVTSTYRTSKSCLEP